MFHTGIGTAVPRHPRLKHTFGSDELLFHQFGISALYRWLAALGYSVLVVFAGVMLYASWEVLANSRTLSDGTRIVSLHGLPLLAAAVAVSLALPAVWAYFLWYLRISRIYTITNQRIIIHVGWLGTRYISINYSELTDVKITRGIVERFLFGTGTIFLNTAGSEGFEVIVRHIDDPYRIKQEIFEMIDG